ncbi:MarR family transcriptional regulator [Solihabitans fulvus]|uniref:MarR family transcriptional regulator n=1 Tax=Solihabitans fulvus TaxID=1892852 RepID=A0A5B2XUU5_9PSEU|nr:MarR family transcriptional regulator [Solihabitans fulvus]KAA2266521.1 MarR family transcriptional regulator [Solihabitans fulvus]
MARQESVTETVVFLLGKLGQATTARFAEALVPLGLRPRHCGVLELLADAPLAQLDLSRGLGVTPSVVVDMLDELEALDAVRRVRDTVDRRRQLIELTAQGRDLQRRAVRLARELDTDLLGALDPAGTAAFGAALARLAEAHGLPTAR